MARLSSYLLTVLLPGAGHIHEHRYLIGWPLALLWTGCWHVILLGVWVIPRFFADWMVPAAFVAAGAIWLTGLISLARGSDAPPAEAPAASKQPPAPAIPEGTASAHNER